MFYSIAWLTWLSCWYLLAYGTRVMAENNPPSGIVEVDLIFPRNDTYDPIGNWPVLFAVQNFEHTGILDAEISWGLWSGGNLTTWDIFPAHQIDLRNVNSSRSGTQFLGITTYHLQDVEATWTLQWVVRATNCTRTNDSLDESSIRPGEEELPYNYTEQWRNIAFTTKKGAAKPDWASYTDSGACNNAEGITFNATGSLSYKDNFEDKTCAILSETIPPPNPCAVEIDNKTVSDISLVLNFSLIDPGCVEYESVDDCRRTVFGESRAILQFSPPRLALFLATCAWLYWILS